MRVAVLFLIVVLDYMVMRGAYQCQRAWPMCVANESERTAPVAVHVDLRTNSSGLNRKTQ